MSVRSAILVIPYAVWMALMVALPATAAGYAVRTAATAAALVAAAVAARRGIGGIGWARLGIAVAVGVVVFGVWILPETLFPPEAIRMARSAYDPAVCGWPLTLVRLAGSAFVISVAEELFFRKWLMEFAGFWWSLGLFAVEHGDRWAVGIAAGLAYALLARRFGVKSAIVAHATTNFALGVFVIGTGSWGYW